MAGTICEKGIAMINQTLNVGELINSEKGAYIIPIAGGLKIPIEGIIEMGRDPGNHYCISDPHVSAYHCKFERRPNGFFLKDLNSLNGVRVNGLKIHEGQLLNGSHIQIGNTEFLFQTECDNELPQLEDLPLSSRNKDWTLRLRTISQLSKTDLPVFLQGESGCGKEVLAKVIHDQSHRKKWPFISVNCSALTESLVESELFGHLKGSFTGAQSDRKGAFEAARNGTLFLDEIGDLPLTLQPKLLRALENKEIRPVGCDRIVETNVRIITATHKDLQKMVNEGQFRADLFFRMHVIKIPIPALRDRMEDFNDLLYFFCRQTHVAFSVQAIEELRSYSWPGNIRELKNIVARASALFPKTYIEPEHLRVILDKPNIPISEKPAFTPLFLKQTQIPLMKEVEKEMIKCRLIANLGNQRKTAADLGLAKSTLHDRIRAYEINVKELIKQI